MKQIKAYSLQLAFALAVTASLGSLVLSEVFDFEPCELCWVQRGFMYIISVLLGIAVYRDNRTLVKFAWPISALGIIVAAYQYFIQWFPDMEIAACSFGKSCTNRDFQYFGFVTIPFMSLVAFIAITILLLLKLKKDKA